jgi:hypothetical protein
MYVCYGKARALPTELPPPVRGTVCIMTHAMMGLTRHMCHDSCVSGSVSMVTCGRSVEEGIMIVPIFFRGVAQLTSA